MKIKVFKSAENRAPLERYGIQFGIGSDAKIGEYLYPYIIWMATTWSGVKWFFCLYVKKPQFSLRLIK